MLESEVSYSLFPSVSQSLLLLGAVCVAVWAFNNEGRKRIAGVSVCILFAFLIHFVPEKQHDCVVLTGKTVMSAYSGQGQLVHFTDNPHTDYLPFFQGNKVRSVTKSRHGHGVFTVGNGTEIIRLTGRRDDASALTGSRAQIALFSEAGKADVLHHDNIPESLSYIIVAAYMPAEEKMRFRAFALQKDLKFIDLAVHRAAVIDLLY